MAIFRQIWSHYSQPIPPKMLLFTNSKSLFSRRQRQRLFHLSRLSSSFDILSLSISWKENFLFTFTPTYLGRECKYFIPLRTDEQKKFSAYVSLTSWGNLAEETFCMFRKLFSFQSQFVLKYFLSCIVSA